MSENLNFEVSMVILENGRAQAFISVFIFEFSFYTSI